MNWLLTRIKIGLSRIFKININYKNYWQKRYDEGGNSGAGSYGLLASFKTEVINSFLLGHQINSVIEFGCGDGQQIKDIKYQNYLGLDVAETSIDLCQKLFAVDKHKSFIKYEPTSFYNHGFLQADLVVCLDVLYHIISEEEFLKTLNDIFSCARSYVILYTSIDAYKIEPYKYGAHVRHRDVLSYLSKFNNFSIVRTIPQRYPNLSSAHFIILKKND